MNKFAIETLTENAEHIRILFVSNHAGTRFKFSRFLKKFFKNIFVVNYADNAIKSFESGYFDLVISDAEFPDMEASSMCKKIKLIAPKKPIIIISKIKDADKIIDLINIGISGFIRIPCSQDVVLQILLKVVLEIVDYKMIYAFQDTIQCIDNIQTNTIDREKIINNTEENELSSNDNIEIMLGDFNSISASQFLFDYPTDLRIVGDKLLEINEKLDLHINLFVNEPSEKNSFFIADDFENISSMLSSVREFENISFTAHKLSIIFRTLDNTQSYNMFNDMILTLSGGLIDWCDSVFIRQDASDIHYFDKSFLADALMLENRFRGEVVEDDEYGELELF